MVAKVRQDPMLFPERALRINISWETRNELIVYDQDEMLHTVRDQPCLIHVLYDSCGAELRDQPVDDLPLGRRHK